MKLEKQYYLSRLAEGKKTHKAIHDSFVRKFDIRSIDVRDALLSEGLIRVCGSRIRPHDGKKEYYYELVKQPKQKKSNPYKWDDGTPKSQGNAFDWRNFSKGLFTKEEIARSMNRPTPNPITTYSRA